MKQGVPSAALRPSLVAGLCCLLTAFMMAGCSEQREESAPAAPGMDSPPTGERLAEPPMTTATAVVLGKKIASDRADEVQQTILDALLSRYREEQGIEVTEEEVGLLVDDLRRGMADDPNLTAFDDLAPEEQAQADTMQREMARSLIAHWKTNRALYEEYGGRVIGQQMGPEPLDAYRQFLEEQQAAGSFAINDPEVEASFWRYFRTDSMHSFLDDDAAARAFDTPPWEQRER